MELLKKLPFGLGNLTEKELARRQEYAEMLKTRVEDAYKNYLDYVRSNSEFGFVVLSLDEYMLEMDDVERDFSAQGIPYKNDCMRIEENRWKKAQLPNPWEKRRRKFIEKQEQGGVDTNDRGGGDKKLTREQEARIVAQAVEKMRR